MTVFFGFTHLSNENATVFASVAIALEAGVLLAAAYMLTRRLWLVIGLHASWNFVQGGVFGIPVSGTDMGGLFHTEFAGPTLLTGGEFGLEGSLITITICLLLGIVLLRQAGLKGQIVPPPWRRKPEVPDA